MCHKEGGQGGLPLEKTQFGNILFAQDIKEALICPNLVSKTGKCNVLGLFWSWGGI